MTTEYHTAQQYSQLQLFILSKACTKCGIEKPLESYGPQKHGRFGKRAECKDCINKGLREKRAKIKENLPSVVILSKVCTKCKEDKPLDAFSPQKDGRAGRSSVCSECTRIADGQWRERRRAKFAAQQSELPASKICATCGIDKNLEEFRQHAGGKYGRYAHCKECVNAASRALTAAKLALQPVPQPGYKFCGKCGRELPFPQAFIKRGYRCIECQAAYDHARITPEYRKQRQARERKPKRVEYKHKYYQENKERQNVTNRAWRKANPDKRIGQGHRRRARQNNAIADPVDYKAILEQYGYYCYICDKPIDPAAKVRSPESLTFDHIKPLAGKGERKGHHIPENIRPAHKCCNSRKHLKLLSEMTPYQRRGPDA